ncbi:MAG TPA: hypothetical protein VLX28_02005 [Thermoanaerobaculia bacterium]|nr:hypothetical protein [Thermoanaerobaculia bacterium]
MIADLCAGSCDSSPSSIHPAGGFVYFGANDGNGRQIWRSDGTAQGTLPLTEALSLFPFDPFLNGIALGSTLIFTAGDAANGTELWSSDGTPLGTGLLADLSP